MLYEHAFLGKSSKTEATMGLLSKGLKILFKVQGYVISFSDDSNPGLLLREKLRNLGSKVWEKKMLNCQKTLWESP